MAHLAREGFDPAFGARPLKRIIQREIGDRAAMLLLEGKVLEGGTIHVDANDAELTVTALDAIRGFRSSEGRRWPGNPPPDTLGVSSIRADVRVHPEDVRRVVDRP